MKSRFDKLCKLKTFSTYIDRYGQTCLENNREVINMMTSLYPDVYHIHREELKHLFRMCLHMIQPRDPSLISEKIAHIKKTTVKGSNSEQHLALILDNPSIAKELFSRNIERWKISVNGNQGYNSPKLSSMTYDEQVSFMKKKGRKGRNTHLDKFYRDPLYFKKMSPLSKYYSGDEWTADEIHTLKKNTLALGWAIESQKKSIATREANRLSGIPPKRGNRGSKSAKVFLTSIANFLDTVGIGYNWGYGDNTERWVKSMYNSSKYYFIDFVCLDLMLAIEFHGCMFHPKSSQDKSYNPPPFVKHRTAKEKFDEDEMKRQSIEHAGFKLFIVYDDENYFTKQQEIIEWIQLKLIT